MPDRTCSHYTVSNRERWISVQSPSIRLILSFRNARSADSSSAPSRKRSADDSCVALTFDDGYDDLMQLLAVISQRGIPITVFVPTAFIGKSNSWDNFLNRNQRRHLSETQIKQLAAAGVEFGSHTHSHCDLSRLSDAAIEHELRESKRILESLTDREVRYIGYPFGRCDNRVVAIAKKLGYRNGFWSAPHKSDGFNFGRTALNRFDSPITIRAKLWPGLLSGAEYLKCLVINRFSHLTPLVARFSSRSDSR